MIHTRRLTLAIGFTQTLAWATTYYIPATMAVLAAAEFGVSRSLLIGGFSLGLLVCGLVSPAVGRWIEKHGGRGVLAAAPLVTAAGLVALALSPNVVGWYLGWMVMGAGMALGLYDAAFGTIGRLLGHAARPAIVGVTLMAGFASTIGWPAGTYLVGNFGWRAAIGAYAAVQLLVILPVILTFVPRVDAVATVAVQHAAQDLPPPKPRAFFWLAAYFTLRSAINSAVFVHLLVLMQGMGFGLEVSVAAAALIGPSQVGARVLDWFFGRGLSPMLAAIIGASVLPISVIALMFGLPAPIFTIGFGASNGIFTISRGTLPLIVFGPSGYAARVGLLARPAMFASALAPTLFAPLVIAWPALWVVILLGALGLTAFGCLLMLRR
jgi:MFS family permease